jgi:hypothetical protein
VASRPQRLQQLIRGLLGHHALGPSRMAVLHGIETSTFCIGSDPWRGTTTTPSPRSRHHGRTIPR